MRDNKTPPNNPPPERPKPSPKPKPVHNVGEANKSQGDPKHPNGAPKSQ